MNRTNITENSDIREIIASYNILLEYFDQIKTYNEIGYQTIHLSLFSALEHVKNNNNQQVISATIEKLNKALEKSKTASSKIEQLSVSGTKLLNRLKEI